MGNCRILHCGTSLVNYYICIREKVAGFTQRIGEAGDVVYFTVKIEGKILCGARGVLHEQTD